jgi:hypothetical protein
VKSEKRKVKSGVFWANILRGVFFEKKVEKNYAKCNGNLKKSIKLSVHIESIFLKRAKPNN